MKGFAGGVGGVCVCMLAIMGTVLCGFALGAEEHHTTTTDYTYTADTTGLFDVSQAKKFTDYSPAANWTGFREAAGDSQLGGVSYSTSARINNYPIPLPEQGKGDQVYISLSSITGYADPPGNSKTSGIDVIAMQDNNLQSSEQTGPYLYWPRVCTVDQVMDMRSLDGYERVDMYMDASSGYRTWAAPSSAWTLQTVKHTSVWATSYQHWMILPFTEYTKVTWIEIHPVQDIVIGHDASGAEIFRSSMGTTTIIYQQETKDLDSGFPATTWGNLPSDIIQPVTTMKYLTYESQGQQTYMDISQGVVPDTTADGAYWSNGYTNGRIDMLIRWNPDTSTKTELWMKIPVTITGTDGTTKTLNYYVDAYYRAKAGDTWSLNLTAADLSSGKTAGNEYAGNFSGGILLSIDMNNDRIVAYAIDTFQSFQDYTLLANPIATIDRAFSGVAGLNPGQIAPGGISAASMTVGTDNTQTDPSKVVPTIGVVGTSVYMGDNTLVMADPTIQPVNLWNGRAPWELRLYSFAIVGDSITISDQWGEMETWKVTDGQITIDGTAHAMSNLWIRAEWADEKWNISFIFGDETPKKAIPIGWTADEAGPTIALGGYWYFSSAYYTGETKTTSTYDFDFQHFIFDSNAAILCYMGILIAGAIVAKRLGGLGIYDMIVLLFAGICGFVLMA